MVLGIAGGGGGGGRGGGDGEEVAGTLSSVLFCFSNWQLLSSLIF